ncbi:LysE family transporter [Gottfriedia solisilvae]|uniref:LysE family transporter n=1 Tax=Gottfriedia solisilvae TaxID=1516104 RepID=UPI003D2F098C
MPVLSFLLFVFVASFTPGPNNIMAMIFANQNGFKSSIRFCFGVGVGFFIIMLICSYFNLVLHSFIPKIELFLTIFGFVYMLYLAYKILKSSANQSNSENSKNNTFFTGILLQFINPKGLIYGLTAVSSFIIPYYKTNFSLIIASFFLAFVGFTSTVCWSAFGSVFQKFLSTYRKQFNIVMALLLVYTAVSIIH